MLPDFYSNFKAACAKRGELPTKVLQAIGRSDGSTGSWKAGMLPKLTIAIELADHLHVSLDELCFGPDDSRVTVLSDDEKELVAIYSRIPPERREMCKDFLRTHMAVPERQEKEA